MLQCMCRRVGENEMSEMIFSFKDELRHLKLSVEVAGDGLEMTLGRALNRQLLIIKMIQRIKFFKIF